MTQVDSTFSPLFLIMLVSVLVTAMFAYFGLLRGELPNMRTSVRGSRVAGVFALIAMALVFLAFYLSWSFGSTRRPLIFMAVAGVVFVAGIFIGERVYD